MSNRRVFNRKNIPTQLPVSFTIAAGLLLDRADAPGWVWGVVGTVVALFWIAAVVAILSEYPDAELK